MKQGSKKKREKSIEGLLCIFVVALLLLLRMIRVRILRCAFKLGSVSASWLSDLSTPSVLGERPYYVRIRMILAVCCSLLYAKSVVAPAAYDTSTNTSVRLQVGFCLCLLA